MTKHFDVAIIGSGFSGSILAQILASRGRSVALIDAVCHPRFAIGESSTPIADLLLRRLGQRYGLPELETLSTYGTWQEFHPQIACGRKRGFSYYVHQAGKEFTETPAHENSLMVAASASDVHADTHWYRRDVDQHLFQQAIAAGATDFSGTEVATIAVDDPHRLRLDESATISADWIIDASGRAAVTANLLGKESLTHQLVTNTHSTFAHFRDVRSWREILSASGLLASDDPFDTDDAAQHHLLGDRWMWMLRLNNGITSVGWTAANSTDLQDTPKYPSIDLMLRDAQLVEPQAGLVITDRLQRLFDPLVAPRCVMLPSTACTIDPLHSTGIAHALGGVSKLAELIIAGDDGDGIVEYSKAVLSEAELLDLLVSTAYRTMHDFRKFSASCMLYFASAISCEELILDDIVPSQLWGADSPLFVNVLRDCCSRLVNQDSADAAIDYAREAIQPWNTTGLMDLSVDNRYAYTATKS